MINIWLSGYLMALAVECILKKRYVLAFYMSLGALLSLYLGVKQMIDLLITLLFADCIESFFKFFDDNLFEKRKNKI